MSDDRMKQIQQAAFGSYKKSGKTPEEIAEEEKKKKERWQKFKSMFGMDNNEQ